MFKINLLKALLLSVATLSRAQMSNMSISLVATGNCNMTSYFRVGDMCSFQLTIIVPNMTTSSLVVEIDSSDNSSNIVAQICRPTITVGSNYNLTSVIYPQMVSSLNTSQFDTVTINFGWLKNSAQSNSSAANSIIINFNTVIISNGQINGSTMWITTSVDYYNDGEIWVGQGGLTFLADSPTTTTGVTFSPASPGTGNLAAGSFGTFQTSVIISGSRYHSVSLTASSSSLSNNPIIICSVHIYSASYCYQCLDSVKANIFSAYAKDQNSATLNLGYVPNIGFNQNNSTSANAYMTVLVTFRAIESATVGLSNIPIYLTVNTVYSTGATTSNTYTYTPTITSQVTQQPAPTPNITTLLPTTPINIYQAFNISMIIQLPSSFSNNIQIDVIPTQGTSDGSPRIKMCSAVVNYNGENVPCGKCMNTGILTPYAQNTSVANTYDSFTYYINNVVNFNFRTLNDDPNVNNMTISLIGQVLYHPLNIYGANLTIPMGITFGNQTIWIGQGSIVVGQQAVYNTSNSSMPSFNMSIADNSSFTAAVGQPRAFFLDIYTQPSAVYEPMEVDFIMPETLLGNGIPAASVCSVQMYYVGVFAVCAQSQYVNTYNISYISTMVQFKNDKAVVTLNALCNSAPSPIMDPIDGLVRFLVYFALQNDSTLQTQNYIGATVDINPTTVYVGQLMFTTGSVLPTSSLATNTLYGYKNTTTSNASATGRSFAVVNYVVKILPSSLFAYNIQTSLSKASLTTGDAAFCTVQVSQVGSNVPCPIVLNHNYALSSTNLKMSDYAFSNPVCSINNLTSSVNQNQTWDADSVNLAIITRPSAVVSGSYSVSLSILDGYSNFTDLQSGTQTFTINIASNFTGTLPSPNYSMMNATVYNVDPTNSTSLVYAYYNYPYLYPGQTAIIRYNLTMNDSQFYDVGLSVATSMSPNSFQLVRFFVSDVGLNFPCVSNVVPITYSNGTQYSYAANMTVGEVAYYPIAPQNMSSNTITFEAHVRIPWNSNLVGGSATVTLTPTFNGNSVGTLNRTTASLSIASPSAFTSTIQNGTVMTASPTSVVLGVRQTTTFNFSLTIPPFSNVRTTITLTCLTAADRVPCNVNSVALLSMGRNVDGLWTQYSYGLMQPVFSRNGTTDNYYNDTGVLDLGIVTNVAYGQKLGNYNPSVDDNIMFSANILLTDDLICNQSSEFSLVATANFDFGALTVVTSAQFTVNRTGAEVPILSMTANILNATTSAFSSGSYVLIQFSLSHFPNSTAEAYNTSAVFYFPPYISFNSIVSANASEGIITSLVDSAVFFNISRVHFGEIIVCTFSVIIDPSNQYSSVLTSFGMQPPAMLQTPFNTIYFKYPRYSPITDSTDAFVSPLSTIQYQMNQSADLSTSPMNPLLALTAGAHSCQVTSSVKGAALSLTVTSSSITWSSSYRAIYWYMYGGTYVQISFGTTTSVTALQLSQMASTGSNQAFSSFQVSFSDDGVAFAYLPVAIPPTTTLDSAPFNYTIPDSTITCSYLRVHIISVVSSSTLSTSSTGLVINEIYGQATSPSSTCPSSTISTYYSPQTYVYSSTLNYFILCDENFNRTGSLCFSSYDSTPTSWMAMPQVVSMVVFWVRDSTQPGAPIDYLYGLGADMTNYVSSVDLGFSWMAVSPNEFNTMKSNIGNGPYSGALFATYTPGSATTVTGSLWTIKVNGAYYNGVLEFDWYS